MTCIVAIEDGDRVWMGCDSQDTWGGHKLPMLSRKVFSVGEWLIGVAGQSRVADVLELAFQAPKRARGISNRQYLVMVFIPTLISTLEQHGALVTAEDGSNSMEATMLMARGGECYAVSDDYSVGRITEYYAIGSGGDLALGSLHSTEGEPAECRILLALEAAIKYDAGCGNPTHIVQTKQSKS
jgi:ATP-dependent protease HslVU (ClpYQ) peptidase subunit